MHCPMNVRFVEHVIFIVLYIVNYFICILREFTIPVNPNLYFFFQMNF